MNITTAQLLHIMPRAIDTSPLYLQPLNRALVAYDVQAPTELCAFLATLAEETAELTAMTENLSYTAERAHEIFPSKFPTVDDARPYAHNPVSLGNKVYANRYGNGDERSGDGYRYRGRSMGITFRDNYRSLGQLIDVELEAKPELLEYPLYAMFGPVALWWKRGLADDRVDFKRATRTWAGALTNMQARERYYERAKEVIH